MKKIILILLIFWCLVIFCLSELTGDITNSLLTNAIQVVSIDAQINTFNFSYLVHLGLFLVLGILLALTCNLYQIKKIYGLIFGFAYGLFDEVHQLYVRGRTFDLIDWQLDCIGTVLGFIVVYICYKIYNKYQRQN